MLTTVPVHFIAYDQNGQPVAGAILRAKLDQTEIQGGFVVPELVEATADDAGEGTLNLWPNALGVAGSMYRITAINPDTGRKFLDATASVPNSACELHQILVQEPYPAVDAAAQALIAAQGALAAVTAQAQIATTKAGEALGSASSASGSAIAAASSSSAASGSAGAASGSAYDASQAAGAAAIYAGQAQSSADAAAGSSSAASASAGTATTKAGEASGYASAAQGSATAAGISAGTAATKASEASASASAASGSAAGAVTSAGTATTKANEAGSSATAASNSAAAAASSASAALGDASTASGHASTATTKAGEAAVSAGTATTKASEASASATYSNASAVAAADSLSDALAIYGSIAAVNAAASSASSSATAAASSATTAGTGATTATAQAAIATAQAVISTSQAADSLSSSVTAQAAAAQAVEKLAAGRIFPTTAAGIGQGVQGVSSIVAGSGGTNGTFALAFSGGTQVIAPVGRFVVAGGVVTSVVINYPGYYSAGTPTLSFAASSGLTGASATAVMGANTPVGEYFSVPSADASESMVLYLNNAGAAVEKKRYPSTAGLGNVAAYANALATTGGMKGRNLFDAALAVNDLYIAPATGEALPATPLNTYYATGFVPVTPGSQIVLSAASRVQAGVGYALYGYSKNFISGAQASIEANTPFTIPANVFFIRLTFLLATAKKSTLMIVDGAVLPSKYISTNYPDALEVDRNVAQKIKESIGIVNEFNAAAITADSAMSSGGGVVVATLGFYVTPFIAVDDSGYVTSNRTATGVTAPYATNFFDAAFNYLGKASAVAEAGVPIAVMPGTAYIRATFKTSETPPNTLMIVRGSTLPANFRKFGIPSSSVIGKAAGMLAKANRPSSRVNLFDRTLITASAALTTDGTLVTPYVGVFTTGYIPVTPDGSFTVAPAIPEIVSIGYGMCFYDADLAVVGGLQGPYTLNQVVSVPALAQFVRFCSTNNHLDTLVVLDGETVAGNVLSHTPAMMSDVSASPWIGKSFAILGDSISANAINWMDTAAAALGATVGTNATCGSRKMVNALKASNDVDDLTAANFTGIHAALLWLGTNDYTLAGVGTAYGTIADSTATATFYGQTKKAVETILGWNPAIRLALGTPLQRTGGTAANSVGKTLNDYAQAIRDVAALYSLEVLDFHRVSGLNTLTLGTYTSDGLHPNPAGYTAVVINPAKAFFNSVYPMV